MTHTTEQLQAMSDFEVNKALAYLLKVKWQISAVDDECLMVGSEVLDYCNNPSDIMPLAFERKVGIAPNKDSWEAFTLADNYQVINNQFVDANPCRAIACLLLLIGGE